MKRIKMKYPKEKKKKNLAWRFLFSFFMAFLVFLLLLMLEAGFQKKEEEKLVILAAADIPKGTELTDEIIANSFREAYIPISFIPEQAVEDRKQLAGNITGEDIREREIVTLPRLCELPELLEELVEPVEVSISVTDLSQVVGGILSAGDRIHLSVTDRETGVNERILTNVYVSGAFTSSGIRLDRIPAEQEQSAATVLNLWIPKAMEQTFNEKINSGLLRISKIQ